MRALVCGGRNFSNYALVAKILGSLDISVVIHGAAHGADTLADNWAKLNGVPIEAYRADWSQHGRAAGPLRNAKMLRLGKPDVVVAFPGGKGTADMIAQARAAGIGIIVVESD